MRSDKGEMIQKVYEALFALEDVREMLRRSTSTQEKKIEDGFDRVKAILDGKGTERRKYITDRIELRSKEEDLININPIQAAGRLTPEARKALIAYGDGYSVCDYCFKPFRLDYIKRPPIADFMEELAEFVGMDVARVVRGARNGFQIVSNALLEKGDVVLVSSLAHYSLCLAIESVGAIWKEVPLNENNIITADNTAEKLEEEKGNTGKLPKLVAISHFDYMLGNEHDVYGIGKVCKEYNIPFLYNGAYTVGVMPVDGKKIGADFIVGSGHKSMASAAPSGILATTDEYAKKVFRITQTEGDITRRKFGMKEVELLGCTLMGAPLLTMMASFPTVKERTKRWDEEVKKSNYFIDKLLCVKGSKVQSEYPRKHSLSKVDTTESFDKVARKHKRRGFFLGDELKERGIAGVIPGATRNWKLNTYGLTWEQMKSLGDAFIDIATKYDLEVV